MWAMASHLITVWITSVCVEAPYSPMALSNKLLGLWERIVTWWPWERVHGGLHLLILVWTVTWHSVFMDLPKQT